MVTLGMEGKRPLRLRPEAQGMEIRSIVTEQQGKHRKSVYCLILHTYKYKDIQHYLAKHRRGRL